MAKLDGRVALITGAGRGIGRAIAEAFASEGASVVINDLPGQDYAQAFARSLVERNLPTLLVLGDVSQPREVQRMVEETVQAWGRIDILVNNAGITDRRPFLELHVEDWDRLLAANLRSTFLCCRYVAPHMIEQDQGSIINLSSQLGQRGAPLLAHYCAAKAGVIGLTKALARELAPTVRVNAVAPGPILTDMTSGRNAKWRQDLEAELPLRRIGTPDDVAPTVLFLASDDARYYTGQTLGPNGGHVMP